MKIALTEKQRIALEEIRDRLNNLSVLKDQNKFFKEAQTPDAREILANRTKRLITCLQPSETNPFPTLALFENFALADIKDLTPVEGNTHRLPSKQSSVNLGALNTPSRYLQIRWNTSQETTEISQVNTPEETDTSFGPKQWSYEQANLIELKDSNKTYSLDMNLYRSQTASTPFIVPSYNGKTCYLVNRDSYVSTSANSFSFSISTHNVLCALKTLGKDSPLHLGPVRNESQVYLSNGRETCMVPVSIMRSDGLQQTNWTGKEPRVSNCTSDNILHAFTHCRRFDHTKNTNHIVHFTHVKDRGVVELSNDLGLNKQTLYTATGLGHKPVIEQRIQHNKPINPPNEARRPVELLQAPSTSKRKRETNNKQSKKIKIPSGTKAITSFFSLR